MVLSYSNSTAACTLAKLTYLEDPAPNYSEQRIYLATSAALSLEMRCRGGEGCCGKETNRSNGSLYFGTDCGKAEGRSVKSSP